MRHLSILTFAFIVCSCSNVSSPADDRKVPKALEEENSSFTLKKYGGREDVVNGMYNELLSDNATLKNLEKSINNLPDMISDAESPYQVFNNNNTSYYNSALNHVNTIKDAALKEKIKAMVEASRSQYNNSVAAHNKLLNEIDWKQLSLNDMHTFLKLVKTLPVIEAYQKKNTPSTSAMENASAEIDKLIQRTKEAAKQ